MKNKEKALALTQNGAYYDNTDFQTVEWSRQFPELHYITDETYFLVSHGGRAYKLNINEVPGDVQDIKGGTGILVQKSSGIYYISIDEAKENFIRGVTGIGRIHVEEDFEQRVTISLLDEPNFIKIYKSWQYTYDYINGSYTYPSYYKEYSPYPQTIQTTITLDGSYYKFKTICPTNQTPLISDIVNGGNYDIMYGSNLFYFSFIPQPGSSYQTKQYHGTINTSIQSKIILQSDEGETNCFKYLWIDSLSYDDTSGSYEINWIAPYDQVIGTVPTNVFSHSGIDLTSKSKTQVSHFNRQVLRINIPSGITKQNIKSVSMDRGWAFVSSNTDHIYVAPIREETLVVTDVCPRDLTIELYEQIQEE